MTTSETDRYSPEVRAEIEKAYRRGYAQAAYCAARDAAEGHDLKAWAYACAQWRYAPLYGPRKWAALGTCPPEAWENKNK
jgi:hypothetical protein